MNKKLIAAVVIVVVVAIVGWRAFSRQAAQQEALQQQEAIKAAPMPVETRPVQRGDIELALEVTGTIQSDRQVNVTCAMPGIVQSVTVNVGDSVRRGQTLIVLKRDKLRDAVRQAEAAVKAARVRYEQAKLGVGLQQTQTSTSIAQAEAAVKAARARLAAAEQAAKMQVTSSETTVAQAEAALKAAEQRLSLVKEGAREQERRVASDAVAQAKANYETAARTLERMRKLLEAGAISQQNFDQVKLQYDIAKQQYDQAQQQYSMIQEGARSQEIQMAEADVARARAALEMAKAAQLQKQMREEDVKAARQAVAQAEQALRLAQAGSAKDVITAEDVKAAAAAVHQAEAALALARHQLADAVITSTISGKVAARNIDPGEMAQPGFPLLVIVDNSKLYLEAEVPQEQLHSIAVGSVAEVEVSGIAHKKLTGRVYKINPAVRPDVRVAMIRIRLDNSEGLLRAGMFAKARVVIKRALDVVVVPREAVYEEGNEHYVFVVEGQTARRRKVKLGIQNATQYEVQAGLREGEQLIVSRHTELRDGQKVSTRQGGAVR